MRDVTIIVSTVTFLYVKMDSATLASQGFLGLRCVRIPRWQHGFGFTLRHFIVYPPELYSEDGDTDGHVNGMGQSRLHKVTEPVDTIFVKSVRENTPAAAAGLCVGDRIVSVNGETIVGKSYDQVVSLIQKTKDLLCLEVSPKQYDTLQLFYEEQAYRPETNQRPYEALTSTSSSEPLYHYPSQGDFHPGSNTHLANDYAYSHRSYDATDYARYPANMSSSHSNQAPAQLFSHLPRPVPYKSSAVWASTSADRNGDRTHLSSLSQSSKAVQRPQPQGYYPFNHSFDKSSVWKVRERDELNSGAKSADSILGESGDHAVYRSPLRSESMECLSEFNTNSDMSLNKAGPGYRYSISTAKAPGTGPSQPSDYRNTMVVTMSSTNTGQKSRHARDTFMYGPVPDGVPMMPASSANSFSVYENQIVDRIRRNVEQKEEFLKRPNQPIWAPKTPQAPPPFPKELYAQPQKFTKVPWPPENSVPAVMPPKQPLQSSVSENRNLNSWTDKKAKSNNVTVISVQHSGPDSLSSGGSCSRPAASTSDSWSPVDRHSESDNAVDVQKLCSEKEISRKEPYTPTNLLSLYELPKNRTTVVGSRKLHCDPPPDWKPDLATLTGYQQPPYQVCSSPRLEQGNRHASFPAGGSIETDAEVQNSTDNVILRRKELEPESESERLVRRVSYLKATSSPIDMERKSTSPTSPVKSFDVMSCKPTFASEGTGRRRSMANKLATEFFPKGRIHKLKQFFEDRTQPSTSLFKFYVDSPTSEYHGLGTSKADKFMDNTEVLRDGKVHFKTRIGENKRGTYNRSWRQGFAQVRRSGYLYLSKERLQKDTAVTENEESVIISVSIRDGVIVEPAEDYTKRKYVIRIRTSFVPDESNFPIALLTDSYHQTPANLNYAVAQLSVELLIQTEDQSDLIFWINCIQKQLKNNNCNTDTSNSSSMSKSVFFGSEFCPKSKSFLTSLLPSPGTPVQNPTIAEKSANATSTTGATSANTLNPNVGGGIANTAASPKVKTWKGKVAKQWKKVHDIIDTGSGNADSKPPSPYASLPPVGATFGINLEECPPGEVNPLVPRVIEYSIELIEKKGIEVVGLYRIPGNNASVAILTDRLNKGEDPNPERDPRWLEVHVVASLIKSFLRRLPDPLLTNDRYTAFIQAADEEEEVCLAKIKELIRGLPPHNYETLKAVVKHLEYVAQKGESNRMDARNLAIVFGPTIVRTAGESINSMVVDMKNQCKIVEALVLHAEEVFNEDESDSKSVLVPVLPQISMDEQHKSDPVININPNDAIIIEEIKKHVPPSPPTIENELKSSLIKAAKRKISAKENQPLVDEQKLQLQQEYKPVDEKGFIRSYAGLNEVTERRIRNFELETKAMLCRDDRSPNSSVLNMGPSKTIKGIEDIRQQQLKLDDALRKAKDDLEHEDIYDEIADNPSSIVQHRERALTLFASSPGPFNLSNSSLSSSNSNSTAPSSLLTSSLPAWPTGNRLGPVPFRNSMPPQSLPPKPPLVTINSTSLNASFDAVPSNAQSQSSIRRVNSFDRLQGSQSNAGPANDAVNKFEKMSITTKDSFRRLRRPDGTLSSGISNPKQLGGSLDSLKDINTENSILGNTRMRIIRTGNGGSREDLSPRSSDGSDMVTTLTKTLDKKLQSLRTQFAGAESNSVLTEDEKHSSTASSSRNGLGDCETNGTRDDNDESKKPASTSNQKPVDQRLPTVDLSAAVNHNSFLKKGRRRHSLIGRRKSSVDVPSKESSSPDNSLDTKSDGGKSGSDVSKVAKPNSKKLAKECRRRHSLSGATDILSLVFKGSEKLSVHKDPDSKKNKTLSSEALLTALKNANILESHV